MTKIIRITFPEGSAWTARGLGYEVDEASVASHIACNAPHCALIGLIEPVLDAGPGDEPLWLGDHEWKLVGWDGDDLVYDEVN